MQLETLLEPLLGLCNVNNVSSVFFWFAISMLTSHKCVITFYLDNVDRKGKYLFLFYDVYMDWVLTELFIYL